MPTAPARTVPRRRTQARSVATRRRLLAAAEELLIRSGYESTSMAGIARRAGVGVGTVYHHFSDKRQLLLELVDAWGERELTRPRGGPEMARLLEGNARQAIRADLRHAYERLCSHGGLYLVVLALADRDPEVRRRFQRIERLAVERLRDLIELGQRRGVMRRDADPLAAAFLIRHAIDMAATEVLVREVSEPAPEAVLEELTEMICRYILEDPR
jgi:AcrR family transcriptional regulator